MEKLVAARGRRRRDIEGGAAPLLFLVFARLFLRAPFVSEPAPAGPTPISLASCCRLAVAVVFRRSASRIPSSCARRSLRRVIISRTSQGEMPLWSKLRAKRRISSSRSSSVSSSPELLGREQLVEPEELEFGLVHIDP